MEGSSLKHFNFQKYTPQQIIDKYESVLAGREEQITLLSLEMGQLNDRLTTLQEENNSLLEENASLKSKLSKKESLLSQELNNKEIMFIRLEKKENEYDLLKKQYDILLKSLEGKTIIATKSQKNEYVSTSMVVEKEVNSNNNETNVNPNNPFNDVVIINENKVEKEDEKGKESEGEGNKQNEDKQQVKVSARVS
jgi:regulator of replication initiation timing